VRSRLTGEIFVLDGLPVLIVEDDHIVAADLADAIELHGGRPIGPATTVLQAIMLLQSQTIGAAILDGNLPDRDVTPVALTLVDTAVPFVIHSGIGAPRDLTARHPNIPVILKPAKAEAVVAALLQQLSLDRGGMA
jgi:DNA-binding NarL/FixJ family response regulator